MQISKLGDCKATDVEKHFFYKRKLFNAILRVQLNYMKYASSS